MMENRPVGTSPAEGSSPGSTNPRFGPPNIICFSKLVKIAGKIGIDLTLIFCINDFFCAILGF